MASVIDELITMLRFKADDKPLKRSKKELTEFQKATKGARDQLNAMRRAMVEAFAVSRVVNGLRNAIGSIVETNTEFQRLQASLKTVTGSAGRAGVAFDMIRKLAKRTPFQVTEVTQAFVKLKALGLDPSEAALISYGNTASAMGKSLNDFIEAIADASTGEFERLKEFGIKSKSEGDRVSFTFQGVTTQVGKNAVEIEQYLRRIGETTFAGAMDEQMKTLGGVFSNLRDTVEQFELAIGEAGFAAAVSEVTTELGNMLGTSEDLAPIIGGLLADATREAFRLFKALVHELRQVKRENVARAFQAIRFALSTTVDILKFFIEHWEVMVSAVAGVKVLQGFNATAAALKGIGVSATASLGPIGAIAAAFVALLPHAIQLGEALGDMLVQLHALEEIKMGQRTGKRGMVPFYGDAKTARRSKEMDKKIAATRTELQKARRAQSHGEIGAAEKVAHLEARLTGEMRTRQKLQDKAAAKQKAAEERKALEGPMDKRESERSSRRAAVAEMRKEWEHAGRTKRGRDFKEGVFQQFMLGKISEEQAQSMLEAGPGKGKKGKGGKKKKKEEKSEAQERIDARIEELAKDAELRVFAMRKDLRGKEREDAALRAGKTKKEQLLKAVNEGRLSALGGEFSSEQQLLRDAGILGEHQQAPPVLTVQIFKTNVHVDAPISVKTGKVNATAEDIGSAVKKGVRDELGVAIREAIEQIGNDTVR